MTPIRVFLVDDHRLFLAGVRAELAEFAPDAAPGGAEAEEPVIEIVGTATEVPAAIDGILDVGPDVVLLDVHLPGGGGRAVLESVRPQRPEVTFLALSVSDAPEDVLAVIRAGARGYVTKTIGADELARAIATVHLGEAVFSPRLAGFVLDAFAGQVSVADVDPDLDRLTPRERDVLRHIARGYTYKEAARRLEISVKTVESHVSAVLRKLQLSSRHELTRWATDRGLD